MTDQDLERQCYIDAIIRLLDKADTEALELIWIAARNLTQFGLPESPLPQNKPMGVTE